MAELEAPLPAQLSRTFAALALAVVLLSPVLAAAPAAAGVTPHCGDASGDGIVNSIDAAIVLQYIAGLAPLNVPPSQLDPDGSGAVDARDVALILQAAAHYYHVRDFRCPMI